ncbi:O-acetyltransferase OatA [compost metagenome]
MVSSLKRNNDIQALRGIAIIMVMLQHYRNRLPTSTGYHEAFEHFSFWGGVDLFFVISGFVIVSSLLSSTGLQDGKSLSPAELATFFKKRAVRLLPASWFWLGMGGILFTAIPMMGVSGTIPEFKSILAGMTGTANFYWSSCVSTASIGTACPPADINSVYWSLSFEEQFYLCFAVSLCVLRIRLAILAWGLYALVFTALSILLHDMSAFSALWIVRPQGMVLGVLLGVIVHKGNPFPRLATRARTVGILVGSVALCWISKGLDLNYAIPIMAAISGIIVILAIPDNSISTGYGRVLQWIGDRSYSIYLSHLLVFHLIRYVMEFTGHAGLLVSPSNAITAVFVLVSFASAMAVGSLSWKYIERRLWRPQSSHP